MTLLIFTLITILIILYIKSNMDTFSYYVNMWKINRINKLKYLPKIRESHVEIPKKKNAKIVNKIGVFFAIIIIFGLFYILSMGYTGYKEIIKNVNVIKSNLIIVSQYTYRTNNRIIYTAGSVNINETLNIDGIQVNNSLVLMKDYQIYEKSCDTHSGKKSCSRKWVDRKSNNSRTNSKALPDDIIVYAKSATLNNFSLNKNFISKLKMIPYTLNIYNANYTFRKGYYYKKTSSSRPQIGDVRFKLSYFPVNQMSVIGMQKDNQIIPFNNLLLTTRGIVVPAKMLEDVLIENKRDMIRLCLGIGIFILFCIGFILSTFWGTVHNANIIKFDK